MAPLLRVHSDEQLVRLFRAGEDEAFKAIHDRYRARLFAYARQMLACRQDAEDVLQDVFIRAYSGLRADGRDLALRAWLYRVAHNRCVDELRRPAPAPPELGELMRPPVLDPIAQAEQRDSLRRLVADVRRLPDQQRSALLMRELTGMSYSELSRVLGISVPAVKSLLVRARVSLAQSVEARETACTEIRREIVLAHDGRRRPAALARRHIRDCPGCREFRGSVRGTSRDLAAIAPALGPVAIIAKLVGFGGGAGGSAAAGGGGSAAAAGAGGGLLAAGAGHAVTLLAAAAVTVGGAAEISHTLDSSSAAGHHAGTHTATLPNRGTAGNAASAVALPPTAGVGRAATGQASVAAGATPTSAAVRPGATPARTSSLALSGDGSQPTAPGALDPMMGPGPLGGGDATAANGGTPGSQPAGQTGSVGTDGTSATSTGTTPPASPPTGTGDPTAGGNASSRPPTGTSLLGTLTSTGAPAPPPGSVTVPSTAGSAANGATPTTSGPSTSSSSAG